MTRPAVISLTFGFLIAGCMNQGTDYYPKAHSQKRYSRE